MAMRTIGVVFVFVFVLVAGGCKKQSADPARDAPVSPAIDAAAVVDAPAVKVVDAPPLAVDAGAPVITDALAGPCPGGFATYTRPGCGKAAIVAGCLSRPQPPCASHQYCGCDGQAFVGCGAATRPFAHAGPCKR